LSRHADQQVHRGRRVAGREAQAVGGGELPGWV